MLLGNGTRDSRNPLKMFAQFPGDMRGNFSKTGEIRNFRAGEGVVSGETSKASVPSGYRHPYTWNLPQKPGGISSIREILAVSSLSGSGARGVNGTVTITSQATLDAIGQLVVSALSDITASGSVSANIVAALEAAANLASVGSVSGTTTALAWAISAIEGQASVSPTIYGTGTLAGDIEVGAQVGLSAVDVAEEVLDSQLVETGLTVRETLRLCLAALAGEVSISGNTVTIRSADDSKDRIVATTDSNGQRTTITLDAT